jgi:fatty-acyl-CoA synthase
VTSDAGTGPAIDPERPTRRPSVLESASKSMWQLLVDTATSYRNRPAVVFGEDVLSYGGLIGRALRCASQLSKLGITHGTKVAILFHSSLDWVVLHYALCRLGAVAVPVNLGFENRELQHVLRTASPGHIITIDMYRDVDHLARLQAVSRDLVDGATTIGGLPSVRSVSVLPVSDDGRLESTASSTLRVFGDETTAPLSPHGAAGAHDVAYVIYTSGSTAFPKPALLSHRALSAAGTGYAAALHFMPDDRMLVMQPTFHVTGPTFLVIAHVAGGAVHLLGQFDATRALDEIETRRCTATVTFPTIITKLMAEPSFAHRDLSSFGKIMLGGTSSYLKRVNEALGLELIGSIYGSTESGGLVTAPDPDETDIDERVRTNGVPLPGVEVRIIDPETGRSCASGEPGEICFRGVVRFDGYLPGTPDVEDAIDEEGFFHSGDYGHLDESGCLLYRGRYKLMVKTGGENVSELEVEQFLEGELELIDVAQVVGVPDDLWGEAIVAFVQLTDGSGGTSTEELRDLCRDRLAAFKIPKLFIEVNAADWPVTSNGRLDRQVLRGWAIAKYGSHETGG